VRFTNDGTGFSPFFRYSISEESGKQYRVLSISVSRSFPVYNQFNYIITVRNALRKVISETSPDLIHCQYSYPAGVVARLIKGAKGIPFVITEHTRIKTTFRSVFHKWLSVNALKNSSANITVSESLRKELLSEGISNVEVVPNVIDTSKFTPARDLSGSPRMGFLGSLSSHNKGLGVLLEACAGLTSDFSLKIGGGGQYLDYYREMAGQLGISEKCNFTGTVAVSDIPGFYKGLNLFVLPSRYETFGIVLVEAMASGLPVISTRCGGPEEIVNETSGLLVDRDNADQLREAITRIYSQMHNYYPEKIHNYARNNWGRQAFINRINPIYQRCL
jgi:glycosyltransferase involved in cell wall biosynthesis